MCVTVWFVYVCVISNITSATQRNRFIRHTVHELPHTQRNSFSCLNTHRISTCGASDISCNTRREKRPDKLKMQTHTHMRICITEHFKPTVLTLYRFPELFDPNASQDDYQETESKKVWRLYTKKKKKNFQELGPNLSLL